MLDRTGFHNQVPDFIENAYLKQIFLQLYFDERHFLRFTRCRGRIKWVHCCIKRILICTERLFIICDLEVGTVDIQQIPLSFLLRYIFRDHKTLATLELEVTSNTLSTPFIF